MARSSRNRPAIFSAAPSTAHVDGLRGSFLGAVVSEKGMLRQQQAPSFCAHNPSMSDIAIYQQLTC
jgi:hypothetical protein